MVIKISPAQLAILKGMQQQITLHSHLSQGNIAPLWPVRSAWVQDYRTHAYNPGMKSILLSTLDALLRLNLVEEDSRYKGSTHGQGAYTWDDWTINYRLTEQGKAVCKAAWPG